MVSRRPLRILRKGSKRSHQKELISLRSAGHEVYDPVPLNLLSSEDQAKIIESRWVIGPRSGQPKARSVGKGYTQIIDKESRYAHTPQATTLKVILLMSQIHRWSLCVSDAASAFLNTPIDGSKGFIHVQAPPETQYPEPYCLETQGSALWSQRFTEIMASSFESSSQKSQPFTDEIRPVYVHRFGFFRSPQSHGHGLRRRLSHSWRRSCCPEVHSGYSGDLQPQAGGIPHFRSPSRVLGSDHQGQEVRSNHHGISAEAHRQSVRSFRSHRKVNHKWSQDSADLKGRSDQM